MKAIFLLALITIGSAAALGQPPQSTHKTLNQPTEIQGYPCSKGHAWFFADGRLHRCTVTHESAVGEVRISAGSYIALHPDGTPDLVQMPHDAPILGLTCAGGSFLGPGKGSVV